MVGTKLATAVLEDARDASGAEAPAGIPTGRELGARGEEAAVAYLERERGWTVLERNWRCSCGEVDIVAFDPIEGCVVLVEVKTRLALGARPEVIPELSVDERKQRKYHTLASIYLFTHPEARSVRFDVIAVSVISDDGARLRHMVAAFERDM